MRQEVEALCQALTQNTTLLELRAGGRPLSADGVAAFSRLLAVNRTLRVLCIGGADFGDEGAAVLAEGLAQNEGLHELDLAGPRGIGFGGAEALSEAIDQQEYRLQRAGAGVPGLRALDLSRNPIGDAGAGELAAHAFLLQRLALSACELGWQAAMMLGHDATCKGSRLRELDLSGNPLGPSGGDMLAMGMSTGGGLIAGEPVHLAVLNLADSGIADAGAAAVLCAAAAVTSLRQLDMSRCGLKGDAVPQSVARPRCNSLTELALSGNDLSTVTISVFVRCCTNLVSLDLSGERDIACVRSSG